MATPIADNLTDNSQKDNTGDAIGGSEVDANPTKNAQILDGTTATALNQDGNMVIANPEFANLDAAAGGIKTGMRLRYDPVSGTQADNDGVELLFQGDDDGGNTTTYAEIEAIFSDVTDTTEDGSLAFKLSVSGSSTEIARLAALGLGVGTTAPLYGLHVKDGTGNAVIGLEATGGDTFQLISHGTGTGLTVGDFSLYDTSTAAHRLVVDANGLLGVRVQDPAAQLHVGLSVVSSAPALSANTVAVFENASSIGSNASIALIAGVEGYTQVSLGDTDDEDRAYMRYDHNGEIFTLQTNALATLTIAADGDISGRTGENRQLLFGRNKMGGITGLSDYSTLSHEDHGTDTTDYGFAQSNAGASFLNSASGQVTSLAVAGTARLSVSATAVTFLDTAGDDFALIDSGTVGATNDGWIEITINGGTQYIRTYTTK